MASPTASPVPSAQVVGNAFVEQYFHILHQSPELVYRFYQDLSVLSRPEPSGEMTSVMTMQAINEKILSLGYKDIKAEIKTVDAQESHNGGVIVLVTGFLTGTDSVKRKFCQSFFLAPQDKGFFVLNDIFRYMDEVECIVNGRNETASRAPLTHDPEPTPAMDHHVLDPATSISEEDLNNGEEVCNPSDNEEGSVVEEEAVLEHAALPSQSEAQPVAVSTPSVVEEDAPKKSYASILKVMKETKASTAVYVPITAASAPPVNAERQPLTSASPTPVSEAPTPSRNNDSESSNLQDEAESHSIYIRGLPLNATVAQLEEEFKQFGNIKPGGIQVRSNKQQGFCFGFVQFESSSSMHRAIEAPHVMIGGREAFVEEKRPTSRVSGGSGGRGRFPPGRGNFRNDGFRGRGNFGGRGYGRNDFGGRGEYSGRGRGSSGRSGESYQRVDQNGNGSVRSGGTNQTAVPP